MQNLTHDIEQYILGRLQEDASVNSVRLRRKELAEMFECVPSQINYVLRSRFSPEHGYIIESRRGEHGYIKIFKISCMTPEARTEHIDDIIGASISINSARRLLGLLKDRGFITQRERLLLEMSLRHSADFAEEFIPEKRDRILASLLKKMLKGLMLIDEE